MKAPALASALPLLVSTKVTRLHVNTVPSDTEEDNTEDEASTAASVQSGQETPTVAKTPSPATNSKAGPTAGGAYSVHGG